MLNPWIRPLSTISIRCWHEGHCHLCRRGGVHAHGRRDAVLVVARMYWMEFLLMRLYLILGSVLAVAALLSWSHFTAYRAGRNVERAAILTRSVEILRERNATDDEVSAFDDMALCNALGGVWVHSDGSCQ